LLNETRSPEEVVKNSEANWTGDTSTARTGDVECGTTLDVGAAAKNGHNLDGSDGEELVNSG
jgi:hypothetical protein